jgi:hypothetical protein
MPGFLLHLGATVLCAHGGQATPSAPNPRVLLSGQPATTLGAPYLVAGCAMPPPIAGNGPCVTGQWLMGATRVLIGGQPALLQACALDLRPDRHADDGRCRANSRNGDVT